MTKTFFFVVRGIITGASSSHFQKQKTCRQPKNKKQFLKLKKKKKKKKIIKHTNEEQQLNQKIYKLN